MPDAVSLHQSMRWHESLIVRVMVLCVVLVLCLLGSVYVLTRHYYGEVVGEMEAKASNIASELQIALEDIGGDGELDIEQQRPDDLVQLDRWISLEWRKLDSNAPAGPATTFDTKGYVVSIPRVVNFKGEPIVITAQFTVDPQTEIVRAFKNRYLMALTALFMVALVAMVLLIARTLRPLRDLSASCAEISEGTLKDFKTRGSTGEVRALEQTFNRMVASLREKEIVEANLRQAQRLSAVGNLAAGVAHDVRNPLNAIKLLSSHALDTLEENGAVPGTAARQIRTIRNEVNRLEEIVSGFLSLAKEEELKREPHAIDHVLSECVRLVRKDAEERQVRLISELRCGDTELMLDEKHWTRAIINVLLNALEACPKGGRVRLFSRTTDTTCEIEVRDDGPGIPKDVIERVFDPYFTTKTTGTGLGLSITRGIVEEHGGTITISSSEGHGAQVLITLPLTIGVPVDRGAELRTI